MRKIAAKLDGVASVGIVDCDRNQDFCVEMGIGAPHYLQAIHRFDAVTNSHVRAGVTGAYPALRWFGGGEPRNGGALPEYNIQQSTVLDIWSEGVLAAAATARSTRQRAGQTRRPRSSEGSGDGTDVRKEEGIDWGNFEEAERAQDRADNDRWRAEGTVDECVAHHAPRNQSGLERRIRISQTDQMERVCTDYFLKHLPQEFLR